MKTDTAIAKQTTEDMLSILSTIFNDIPTELLRRFHDDHSVNLEVNKQMTSGTLGRYHFKGLRDDGTQIARIRLSAYIDPREIEETVRHELAHATNRKFRSGHGPAWQEEAALWGAQQEPKAALPNRVNIFDVTCPSCEKVSPFPSKMEDTPFIFARCDCGKRICPDRIKKYVRRGTTQTLDSGDHGRIVVDIESQEVSVKLVEPKFVKATARHAVYP